MLCTSAYTIGATKNAANITTNGSTSTQTAPGRRRRGRRGAGAGGLLAGAGKRTARLTDPPGSGRRGEPLGRGSPRRVSIDRDAALFERRDHVGLGLGVRVDERCAGVDGRLDVIGQAGE